MLLNQNVAYVKIFYLIKTFFVIQYRNMKRYISILSILACVFGSNYVRASECVGDECYIDEYDENSDEYIENTDVSQSEYASDYKIDVLRPIEPDTNNWVEIEEDKCETCDIIEDSFITFDYNCPFETAQECKVWSQKPIYNTVVAPRNPHINYIKLDGILATLTFNGTISANDAIAKPLLNRYLALMRASRTCCNEGIIYKMRTKEFNNKKIYNFLKDDVNEYAVGARCMMMDDSEISDWYSYDVTGDMVADVRDSCLCKNRKWIDSLLKPFFDLYQMAPDFEYMPFYYTYYDGFQREITVSVNDDVKKVMELLSYCPK